MSETIGRVDGRPLFQHKFLDGQLDRVRYPDGSTGEQVLIHHPGASAVVPFLSDPRGDDPQVLLIHQYRYATGGKLSENTRPAGSRRTRRRSPVRIASCWRRPAARRRRWSR